MDLHPLAVTANAAIEAGNPAVLTMLSEQGRRFFFPTKGILAQSAEAKSKAGRCNATVGIATDGKLPLHLPCVSRYFADDLDAADIYPYAPSGGRPELRTAWAARIRRLTPSLGQAPVSLPVATNALTHGLALIGDLFLDPDDEVLVPDLRWENYDLCWQTRLEARLVDFPIFDQALTGFAIDGLEAALAARRGSKVMVILNFPNNPTGYNLTTEEATAVVAAVTAAGRAGTRVVAVCDDAYYGMNYEDDLVADSLFGRLAQADPNVLAIKADGATKEMFVWGLRVGFLTYGCAGGTPGLYQALEQKTAGLIRGTVSNITMPGQAIVERVLRDPDLDAEVAATVVILRKRYAAVRTAVERPAYADCWDVYPFNAGYFMCLRLKGVTAEVARQHLLEHHGIGLIALGEYDLRVAYSCVPVDKIEDLFARVAETVSALR